MLSLFYGELAPRRTPLASKWPAHLSHLPCHEIRLFRWTQQHNAFRREQAHGAKAQASLRTPGSRGWSVPHPDLRSDTPLECGSLLSLFYGELAPRCTRLASKWPAHPTHLPCHAIRLRRFVCMEGPILRASTNHWIRASNAAWLDGHPSLVFRHGHQLRCSTHTKTRTARHRVARLKAAHPFVTPWQATRINALRRKPATPAIPPSGGYRPSPDVSPHFPDPLPSPVPRARQRPRWARRCRRIDNC